jgi:hypothetical protein
MPGHLYILVLLSLLKHGRQQQVNISLLGGFLTQLPFEKISRWPMEDNRMGALEEVLTVVSNPSLSIVPPAPF